MKEILLTENKMVFIVLLHFYAGNYLLIELSMQA